MTALEVSHGAGPAVVLRRFGVVTSLIAFGPWSRLDGGDLTVMSGSKVDHNRAIGLWEVDSVACHRCVGPGRRRSRTANSATHKLPPEPSTTTTRGRSMQANAEVSGPSAGGGRAPGCVEVVVMARVYFRTFSLSGPEPSFTAGLTATACGTYRRGLRFGLPPGLSRPATACGGWWAEVVLRRVLGDVDRVGQAVGRGGTQGTDARGDRTAPAAASWNLTVCRARASLWVSGSVVVEHL